MWPLSTRAAAALVTSHSMRARATAYTAVLGVIPNLPVTSGSVTVDATSQQRRSATVGISDRRYWPADPFAILSPLGSELLIEYGIVLPNRTIEWVPLIRGPITDAQRKRPTSDTAGAFTVTVADRSLHVIEARFDAPTQTIASATVVAEITRLIQEALPGNTVTDLTGSTQVAAQLDLEKDRWAEGVEKLADSIGAEVFAGPAGDFVIRPQPTLTATPVWTLSTANGGTLVALDEHQTRENAYSKVVASGQRTDGTLPVWSAVSDTDPASPTYISGPFGTKTRFYSSNSLTTTGQCTTAATALLERTKGMAGTVTLTAVVNPALDAGDVLTIVDGGVSSVHIVDSVRIPLEAGTAQNIVTRSQTLPPEVS